MAQPTGQIRAARLDRSPRLQRFVNFLSHGDWRSTREIVLGAEVMAVSACASELRAQAIDVETKFENKRWYYRIPNFGLRTGDAR